MVTTANPSLIAARLFGSSLPATGESAELALYDDHIEVRVHHRELSCPFASLKIREAGFGGAMGYELAWESEAGSYALHVVQPDAVHRLRLHPGFAALPQVRALANTTRRHSIGRTVAWVVVLTIVFLPVLAILVFIAQADRVAEILASKVPIEQEVQLGEATFASLRPSLTLIENGGTHEVVQELGARLAAESNYSYRFHVAQDPTINAFALPGGIIVVHTGLIAATDRPEELAGVLAHEIQHVEQRHSLRGAFKELGLRGLWALATGDVGSTIAGQAALELTSRKFSRDDESDADTGAFEMLVEKKIDPSGMAEFFTTMSEESKAELPEFLSTHPAGAERQRRLLQRAEQLRTRSFDPLVLGDWPPIPKTVEN
jgi:Zn-dependent protease with chaperone function